MLQHSENTFIRFIEIALVSVPPGYKEALLNQIYQKPCLFDSLEVVITVPRDGPENSALSADSLANLQ